MCDWAENTTCPVCPTSFNIDCGLIMVTLPTSSVGEDSPPICSKMAVDEVFFFCFCHPNHTTGMSWARVIPNMG